MVEPQSYTTKKPVLEAMQNLGTPESIKDICRWVNGDEGDAVAFQYDPRSFPDSLQIRKPSTNIHYAVRLGDFVVRIGKGEFFVMDGYQFQELFIGAWDTV